MRLKTLGLIVTRIPGKGASWINTKEEWPEQRLSGMWVQWVHESQASPQMPKQREKKPDTLNLEREGRALRNIRCSPLRSPEIVKLHSPQERQRQSQQGKNLHKSGHSKGSLCIWSPLGTKEAPSGTIPDTGIRAQMHKHLYAHHVRVSTCTWTSASTVWLAFFYSTASPLN